MVVTLARREEERLKAERRPAAGAHPMTTCYSRRPRGTRPRSGPRTASPTRQACTYCSSTGASPARSRPGSKRKPKTATLSVPDCTSSGRSARPRGPGPTHGWLTSRPRRTPPGTTTSLPRAWSHVPARTAAPTRSPLQSTRAPNPKVWADCPEPSIGDHCYRCRSASPVVRGIGSSIGSSQRGGLRQAAGDSRC
jgi:hypothetical protein